MIQKLHPQPHNGDDVFVSPRHDAMVRAAMLSTNSDKNASISSSNGTLTGGKGNPDPATVTETSTDIPIAYMMLQTTKRPSGYQSRFHDELCNDLRRRSVANAILIKQLLKHIHDLLKRNNVPSNISNSNINAKKKSYCSDNLYHNRDSINIIIQRAEHRRRKLELADKNIQAYYRSQGLDQPRAPHVFSPRPKSPRSTVDFGKGDYLPGNHHYYRRPVSPPPPPPFFPPLPPSPLWQYRQKMSLDRRRRKLQSQGQSSDQNPSQDPRQSPRQSPSRDQLLNAPSNPHNLSLPSFQPSTAPVETLRMTPPLTPATHYRNRNRNQNHYPTQQYYNDTPLSASTLASATPEAQIRMIGERLYHQIVKSEPDRAGRITGILLASYNGNCYELLNLLESPDHVLEDRIHAVLAALESHQTWS